MNWDESLLRNYLYDNVLTMPILSERDRVQLRDRWREPHRVYHDERHLAECLRLFDEYRGFAVDAEAVEAALWLHDAIYDPARDDNEVESAALARRLLLADSVGGARIAQVEALILATRHVATPRDADAQLVCDIDLAILGADDARFDEYERDVRREYGFVPEAAFRAARAAVLERFLDRSAIYTTPALHERFEVRARTNLGRSLRALRAGG